MVCLIVLCKTEIYEKVQVGNDHEKAQSERHSHSKKKKKKKKKNPRRERTKLTIRYLRGAPRLFREHIVSNNRSIA